MTELRVAVATDDGKVFMTRHFGDASFFDIYTVTATGSTFVKRIENSVGEAEGLHADVSKAGGISGLLKSDNVRVTVSPVFGPNIQRIKKHFVCVRMNDALVADALVRLEANFGLIEGEWEKGDSRDYLTLLV